MNISEIDYLGIDRVLKRGSGQIIVNGRNVQLVKDSISGAYFLVCDDPETAFSVLDKHIHDCSLLMVSDHTTGLAVFERYGFSEKIECYQAAYYGEKPQEDPRLSIRSAEEDDLAMLMEHYHMLSQEELEQLIGRRSIDLAYYQGQLAGFIGEHLEGSMGILYVLPEYRKKGFGTALQKHLIRRTMESGYIPFGQVEKSNLNSLGLQKKLGMCVSERLMVWMWK